MKEMLNLRVIGIDPGLTRTGFGIVDRIEGRFSALVFGVVRTPTSDPTAIRLATLGREIAAIIAEFKPQVAAVERLFFNSNVRTAMSVGQASGVVLAGAAEAGMDVATYTPTEVKQSVVGFGGASKQQVVAMVTSLLHLSAPPSADAADAFALAICHLNRSGLARAITRALA